MSGDVLVSLEKRGAARRKGAGRRVLVDRRWEIPLELPRGLERRRLHRRNGSMTRRFADRRALLAQ